MKGDCAQGKTGYIGTTAELRGLVINTKIYVKESVMKITEASKKIALALALAGPLMAPGVWADTALRVDERIESRQDRREDAVENTASGVNDRQEFREERRDCVGKGHDCRQDNRHDRAQDSVERTQDRVDDRQDRRDKRF